MKKETIPMATEILPVVRIEGGKVFTNSRDVADFFGKRHDNVIRGIDRALEEGCLHLEGTPYFQESTYIHEQNRQEYRTFNMTRDGFTLLVMGYTGKSAMAFKVAYIQRFNEMEETLKNEQRTRAHAFEIPASYSDALRLAADQADQIETLEIENQEMSDELNMITCDEFRALKHCYLQQREKIKLGKEAAKVARANDLEIEKEPRTVRRNGATYETHVNRLPRSAWEEAYAALFTV
jgi:Rha family phage regulatory protein